MFTTSNEPCELRRLVRWRIKLSLLLLLTIASNLACAQTTTTLYKSIGPDGKATYSDRPTPTAREAKALTFYSAPASPLSAETLAYIDQLGKSADARPPVSSSDTVLFSAVWCGYCKQAKAYLVSKHVAYRELDIDTKDGLVAYARAGGKRGVPLLLANGQSVTGLFNVGLRRPVRRSQAMTRTPTLASGSVVPDRSAAHQEREGTRCMLRNLNVFIACWVIAGATIGAPIALLVSFALRPILGERAASNYMFVTGYVVLGLVLAFAWWKTGLSPDARKPEREGRFKAGHRVLGTTNILCCVALVLPFLLARITGNSDLAMLAWFALPVYMLAFVAWPAGLFMVWSSRA